LLYLVFCWFFFNVGPALQSGKWDRAAIYLQDWYSWRAQPRLRFGDDGAITPQWSSRGQYPDDAVIDWLTPNEDGSMTVRFGSGDRLEVSTTLVEVHLGGTPYRVEIGADAAILADEAPGA